MAAADDIVLSQAPQQQTPVRSELELSEGSTVTINVASGETGGKSADVAGILQIIASPLLLLVLILVFRRQLIKAFAYVASNVRSISIAGVGIELPERSAPPIVEVGRAAVDIRQAGTEHSVNDSTLRSFYDQIQATSPLDLAVVDIGIGYDWLTPRRAMAVLNLLDRLGAACARPG